MGRNDLGASGLFPSNYVKEFITTQLPAAKLAIPPDNSGVFRVNDIIRIVHVYDNGFCIIFSEPFQACKIMPKSNLFQSQAPNHFSSNPQVSHYPPSPVQNRQPAMRYSKPNIKPLPQSPASKSLHQSSYNSSPQFQQRNCPQQQQSNFSQPSPKQQQYYSPTQSRNQPQLRNSTSTISPWRAQYPPSPQPAKKLPELSAREIERNERIKEKQRIQQAMELEKIKAANATRELNDLESQRKQRITQDLEKAEEKRKAREYEQKQRWEILEQQRKMDEAELKQTQLERENELRQREEEIRLEKERKQREKELEEQKMKIAKQKALEEIEEYRKNEFEYYKRIRQEKARQEEEWERMEDEKWEQEIEKRELRKKEKQEWDALFLKCKNKKKGKKSAGSDDEEDLVIVEAKTHGLMDDLQTFL